MIHPRASWASSFTKEFLEMPMNGENTSGTKATYKVAVHCCPLLCSEKKSSCTQLEGWQKQG